jgi:hypothetical protein
MCLSIARSAPRRPRYFVTLGAELGRSALTSPGDAIVTAEHRGARVHLMIARAGRATLSVALEAGATHHSPIELKSLLVAAATAVAIGLDLEKIAHAMTAAPRSTGETAVIA